jgi:Flp pilus assembly protein TadB
MEPKFGPELGVVISVLQTALTPAFLLVAVGSLLNVLTGRLSRIVDRSRDLQRQHAETEGSAHERVVTELRIIEKRMHVVGSSILFAVLAAITVCIMIALLFLMGLTHFSAAWVAVAVFMLALALLVACLLQFVREIRLATYAIYVPEEYLERPPKPKRNRRVLKGSVAS